MQEPWRCPEEHRSPRQPRIGENNSNPTAADRENRLNLDTQSGRTLAIRPTFGENKAVPTGRTIQSPHSRRVNFKFWRGANRTRTQAASGTRTPTRNGVPMPTPFSTVDDSTWIATEWIWPFHRRVRMLRCSMACTGGCCVGPERSRLRKSRNRTVIPSPRTKTSRTPEQSRPPKRPNDCFSNTI